MNKVILMILITLALITSCTKPDPSDNDETRYITNARDTLYLIMKHWYYWYDKMPVVNKDDYPDPYKLMDALRYKQLDRFSYVADFELFMAEMGGEFIGHGIRMGLDESLNARIAQIYERAPLYTSGVRRGWIVKEINDHDIANIFITGNLTAYNEALGPAVAGVTNTFLFGRPDGKTDTTIISTKSAFLVNSVILTDTLHLSSGVTGHLVMESFIEPTEDELETAFAFFKSNNIQDLIIDFRYSPGGYLDIARTLASYIVGDGKAGTIFANMQYNDKNPSANTDFKFITTPYSLSLSRLVVITSGLTTSAPECIMNGLDPHLNVISIGDTTNGKPTGMNMWVAGDNKFCFLPVTFKNVNSLGIGDYFEGIPPDKLAVDDITHDFNDRNEECLAQAISYLETGAFTGKKSGTFRSPVIFREKPGLINSTFIRGEHNSFDFK